MKAILSNETGGGKKPIIFDVDFVVFEPECAYLCNGDMESFNRNDKYIPKRKERVLGVKREMYQEGEPLCTIVAKISIAEKKDVGRKYWQYGQAWYPCFYIEEPSPPPLVTTDLPPLSIEVQQRIAGVIQVQVYEGLVTKGKRKLSNFFAGIDSKE